ncbi:hypothetical protein JB92DRAFT_3101739 [Gautieria morchelliformis]|nr:hypothetical protein JB92DRAFT_3101739 [Gautieria morchelliformis]
MSFDPQSIVTALESRKSELTPTKYSWVASLTFMLYDHVTTLDVEVVNVWNRPRSLSKSLFIWTRYFGLASLIMAVTVSFHGSLSNKVCIFLGITAIYSLLNFIFSSALFTLGGWLYPLALKVKEYLIKAILLIRVYAVYNRNKYILCGLAGLLLLTIITTIILWVFYQPPALGLPPIDGMTGCIVPTTSIFFGLSFIPAMLNEVILCFFMLYQAWITYKVEYGSQLLKILIQGSVLYFSSIFVLLLTNCLVLFFAPRSLMLIGVGWMYAVPSTMGSRLLLSMLQQASREHTSAFQSDHVRYRMQDLSTKRVEGPVKAASVTPW